MNDTLIYHFTTMHLKFKIFCSLSWASKWTATKRLAKNNQQIMKILINDDLWSSLQKRIFTFYLTFILLYLTSLMSWMIGQRDLTRAKYFSKDFIGNLFFNVKSEILGIFLFSHLGENSFLSLKIRWKSKIMIVRWRNKLKICIIIKNLECFQIFHWQFYQIFYDLRMMIVKLSLSFNEIRNSSGKNDAIDTCMRWWGIKNVKFMFFDYFYQKKTTFC